MKNTLLILSAIFVLASCGKYEKPFISFKSPEKRLIDKTWKLDKIIDTTGAEITSNQTISFSIEGSDSILVRTIDNVIYTGTWNWLAALDGKIDKQRVETFISTPLNPTNTKLVYDVKVLTSKKLELVDRNGATTANYRYYFIKE
jgi:SHS2 domain-containing protein